jgi:hypothetical protein
MTHSIVSTTAADLTDQKLRNRERSAQSVAAMAGASSRLNRLGAPRIRSGLGGGGTFFPPRGSPKGELRACWAGQCRPAKAWAFVAGELLCADLLMWRPGCCFRARPCC